MIFPNIKLIKSVIGLNKLNLPSVGLGYRNHLIFNLFNKDNFVIW
eukprot:UN22381